MFPETLYEKTGEVLIKIAQLGLLGDFYLAGGTGLALQLGHRRSIDLDFFTKSKFSSQSRLMKLKSLNPSVSNESEGTLDLVIDTVKVSFLTYDYDLLSEFVTYENVNVASVVDIACMKLTAISSRGSKKDFIDLYQILQKLSFDDLLSKFRKKYAGVSYVDTHILKSLVYFDDAENDPMPDMLVKTEWPDVKSFFEKLVSGRV